ncbi:MAG: hypothetical protein HKN64_07565 [Woeseiaceae bacterium]|nr:hypothetical protein [Woeseiaceae bacterium]
MFDFKRTLELIKGAVFDPQPTWDSYLPDADDWKKTAAVLTGPLIVGSGVLAFILDRIFPNRMAFIPDTSLLDMIKGIVMAAVAAVIIAFIFAFLAGLFKGKNSFPKALAATSLAFVPGYFGNALVHLPWIGWLLGMALGIYGLVLLWRILPGYLEVPGSSRVGHYILSLAACIAVFVIMGFVFGAGMAGSKVTDFAIDERDDAGSAAASSIFGGLERQGRIIESADQDSFDPPGNGKLSRSQVRDFVAVMAKTQEFRNDQAERLEALSEKAENNDVASMAEAMSGLAGVASIANAEMEVVKTGGGNWAEHQWVKEQLFTARIQKDINDAVSHNYALYQEFEEELKELGF